MRKLEKNDIKFYFALALFAICCVCRFLGYTIVNDNVVLGLVNTQIINVVVTCAYFVVFFFFYILCTVKYEGNDKKTMYYLATFLSVFVFPMFTSGDYFGDKEVYAWSLSVVAVILILLKKLRLFTVPIVFLVVSICPTALFSSVCCVVVLLAYQYLVNKEKKCLWIFILNILSACCAFVMKYSANGISVDASNSISLLKFVVLVFLMSPYLLIAYSFFAPIFKEVKEVHKSLGGYLLLVLGVVPTIVFDLITHDYSKAFFHVFTYFILVIMALIGLKDAIIVSKLESLREKISEYVPIPTVVIIYPFIFMTLWISGFVIMPAEIFVG